MDLRRGGAPRGHSDLTRLRYTSSVPHRTIPQELEDLRRARAFSEDQPTQQTYGRELLRVLARALSEKDYLRVVGSAVQQQRDHQGLIVFFMQPRGLPLPGRTLAAAIQALYREERSFPLTYAWVGFGDARLVPQVRAVIGGRTKYDTVEVGHVAIDRAAKTDLYGCADDLSALQARFGPAPVYVVVASLVRYPQLRGTGIGRALYTALIEALAAIRPAGFYLAPHRCSIGATSPDAERVWAGLRRIYPHAGRVIYVGPGA